MMIWLTRAGQTRDSEAGRDDAQEHLAARVIARLLRRLRSARCGCALDSGTNDLRGIAH